MASKNREELKRELRQLQARELEIQKLLRSENESETQNELDHDEIKRYSRQLLLPEWGVKTQIKLSKKTKGALVVGGGGLGCPAVQFMAAAGLSPIGVIDYDTVDLSNLHRQVLHSETKQDMTKVDSIVHAISQLNSRVKIRPFYQSLDSSNALEIIQDFDVVLDCSDNVATRYLLNDACVLAKKPLISGSALRFEGQLTVYNYKGGPTYRCLFPEPPPAETVTNCSDGGVVGVVPGIIGSLQAQEALKILGEFGTVLSGKMLLYDGFCSRFTVVKLRGRSENADKIEKLIDYEQFCGAKATDKEKEVNLLQKEDRLNVQDYKKMVENGQKHVLIDVRTEPEMDICKLKNSLNFPLSDLERSIDEIQKLAEEKETSEIVIICRRGNDSQKAVNSLKSKISANLVIKDIIGGLYAWSDQIDSNFPKY